MKNVLWCWLILAPSLLPLSGCGQARDESSDQRGAEGISSPSALPFSSSQSTSDVRLESVSCQQWDEAFAAQRGKIVVVDTWATWCVPCREEFPKLVDLHARYAQDGIVCMSVSVDSPEERETALAFLQQHAAAFANYLIEDKADAWWDKWDIKSIPIVLVFNRDGELAEKFTKDDPDDQFTYADVERQVVELLGRSEPIEP